MKQGMESIGLGDTFRNFSWYQLEEQQRTRHEYLQRNSQSSLVVLVCCREQTWYDDRPAHLYLDQYVQFTIPTSLGGN
jgi:hypothetical protein